MAICKNKHSIFPRYVGEVNTRMQIWEHSNIDDDEGCNPEPKEVKK